jgi:hypothetical protein
LISSDEQTIKDDYAQPFRPEMILSTQFTLGMGIEQLEIRYFGA